MGRGRGRGMGKKRVEGVREKEENMGKRERKGRSYVGVREKGE